MKTERLNINFKGYDARSLKGFLMSSNCHNIALEMSNIGKKEGFKIYTVKNNKFVEDLPKYSDNTIGLWAQDFWGIVKNKLLAIEYDKKFYAIKNALGLKYDFTEKVCHETDTIRELNQNIWDIFDELKRDESVTGRSVIDVAKDFENKKMQLLQRQKEAHIAGGNIFIVKGNQGDEIIVGENELEKFSIDEILAMYDCDRITILPQMDFHLDLFIRPLDKKRILVADDTKTLEVLKKIFSKISSLSKNERKKYKETRRKLFERIKLFEKNIKRSNLPNADMVCEKLQESGFIPIKVPARLYDIIGINDELSLQHYCNYINANVIKNKRNENVYITNKSNIDSMLGLTPEIINKIGLSFEKSFIDSILPYVKPNKIYFIKGDNNFVANEMLTIFQGGIHCASMEIPNGLKIKK